MMLIIITTPYWKVYELFYLETYSAVYESIAFDCWPDENYDRMSYNLASEL